MLVAPREQRNEHGEEIPRLWRQNIFVARRAIAIATPDEHAGLGEMREASRQDVGRNPETWLELVETRHALKGIPQDHDTPPFAYRFQRASLRDFCDRGGFLMHDPKR